MIETKMDVYLDNAATTRLSENAMEVMKKVYFDDYGNPSSLHGKGLDASTYIQKVRKLISDDLKCMEKEIIFTSGGTESNNMALFGTAMAYARSGKHIITTAFEHASVYNPLIALEKQGYEVTYLRPDVNGQISPEQLAECVRSDTIMVSMMMVNNEVGAVLNIKKLSDAAKKVNPNLIVHCDAIQAYPKYKIVPKRDGIDILSVSSHKFGGPKGCGFVYIKDKLKTLPLILGGGQQGNMRSGTENVPGIAGMGEALALYISKRNEYVEKMYSLKERFIEGVSEIEGVVVNAVYSDEETDFDERIHKTAPHIISVSFPKVKSEVFLHALEMQGVYSSSGSACSSNHPAISGALKAIGVADEYLDTTLRFSLSPDNSEDEIDYAVRVIKEQLPVYQRFFKK